MMSDYIFISIPEAIINSLSSKAKKELESAIGSFSLSSTVRQDHGNGYNNVFQTMKHGQLHLPSHDETEMLSNMMEMSIDRKRALDAAAKAKGAVNELAKIKESMKLLKGVINE